MVKIGNFLINSPCKGLTEEGFEKNFQAFFYFYGDSDSFRGKNDDFAEKKKFWCFLVNSLKGTRLLTRRVGIPVFLCVPWEEFLA